MTLRQISQKYKLKPLTFALAGVIFTAPIANAESLTPTNNPSNTATSATTPAVNTAVTPVPMATVTTSVKVIAPNLPLNQPNMTDNSIINWATEAAKSIYSYDFKNYNRQMQLNQQYFTAPGWSAFMTALEKSNNLKVVQDKKLVASAVPTGKATIVSQGIKNGIYTWKIELPLAATYENESKLIKQNLLVTMLVSRNNSSNGVGISHFVATVQPANQPPMTTSTTSTMPASTLSVPGTTQSGTTNIYNSPTTPSSSVPGAPGTTSTPNASGVTPPVNTAPTGSVTTPTTIAPTPSGTMPSNNLNTTPNTTNTTPPAAGFGAPAGTVGSPATPGNTGPSSY